MAYADFDSSVTTPCDAA